MRRSFLLLLLAGCEPPAAPTQPTLDFESSVLFGIPTLPTTAVGEAGAIPVTGVLQTASSGYSLVADVIVTAPNTLTLEIEAQLTGPSFGFLTQNYYRARLMSLAAGDYDLTVIHVLPDPAPPRRLTVYHQTVRVD